MPDMEHRIEEIREALARAVSDDALQELRVRYLGRKAELPNLLRGVSQLPPEERGTVGKAANQARQAGITQEISEIVGGANARADASATSE